MHLLSGDAQETTNGSSLDTTQSKSLSQNLNLLEYFITGAHADAPIRVIQVAQKLPGDSMAFHSYTILINLIALPDKYKQAIICTVTRLGRCHGPIELAASSQLAY